MDESFKKLYVFKRDQKLLNFFHRAIVIIGDYSDFGGQQNQIGFSCYCSINIDGAMVGHNICWS